MNHRIAPGKTARTPALGINFEHGENGAVMLYDGEREQILGMIPVGYAVNVNAASVIGMAWKKNNKRPLPARQVREILDETYRRSNPPISVTPETLEEILGGIQKHKEPVAS